ncbi:TPA: hypothetical protein KOB88_002543 [Clostridioides difficile]|uniref:hypothetical protein n=1 Tax=Clostridioides difficile TaxID=1496 RepID=UPI0003B2A5C3|nr:hypothetical protein [Clostridioides difficile]MDI3074896.1 hypothetical protein [Clostridioides difficile]MDK3168127.1 hypothetical protein [Clostridioides difficile]MDW0077080.1 hypothetical protein [Clostridioides difficile]CCL32255.1 hypothetical protein BN174_3830002 [Clostridioides difficile E15]HBF3307615.1 hypothetical protein [Clostridioides difficile]
MREKNKEKYLFLKMKNGKVIKYKSPFESTKKDDNTNETFLYNRSATSRNTLKIIFILFTFFSFSLLLKIVPDSLSKFDYLPKYITMEKKEPLINKKNSNKDIYLIEKAINLENILLKKNYDSLKHNALLYYSGNFSFLDMQNYLSEKKQVVEDNLSSFHKKDTLFEQNKDIYLLLEKRHLNFKKLILNLISDLERSSIIETINTNISEDNFLLEKEMKLFDKLNS